MSKPGKHSTNGNRTDLESIIASYSIDEPPRQAAPVRPEREWYGSLEVYRGLAAALIVVYHVYQYARSGPESTYPLEGTWWHIWLVNLDNFVGLFFVLSAFLLGLPYVRATLHDRPLDPAKEFLFKRFIRIVPLNTVAVAITWAYRTERIPGDWLDLIEHLTFTQIYDNQRIFWTIGPAWSVAVEAHFYILIAVVGPIVCRICRKLPEKEQRVQLLMKFLGALFLASFMFKLGAHVAGVDQSNWMVWFGLLAKLDIFAIGLLLAVIVGSHNGSFVLTRQTRQLVGVVGLTIVGIGMVSRSFVPLPTYVYQHTATAIGFVLMLGASVAASPTSSSWLASRRTANKLASGIGRSLASVGATIGLISYSLYLWHEPLMLYLVEKGMFPIPTTSYAFPLGVAILLPAAIAVSWLSYWTIEFPTRLVRRTRLNGLWRDYYRRVG